MSRKDIIRWVIERMMAHEASITEELALTVEREAREEWGGQRIEYVARNVRGRDRRRIEPDVVAQRVATAEPGRTAEQVAAEIGISRSALYKALARRNAGGG